MTRASAALEKISYQDLYARWEKGNWRSTEIDFSQDRKDWHETFGDLERRGALWNYAMFFHGEDSVADNLSPYIDAAPREEQKYFLATQQVDEARHAVFFARFMREVVDAGEDVGSSLTATKSELTWGFRRTFAHLDEVADRLRKDRSKPMFAAAITMYHLVVEAALAQPGQHFIEHYLEQREVLPGFYSGMRNVSFDEQRHIGFGVKVLSELIAESDECKQASIELLRDVIPLTAGVFVPPGWDERYVTCFGSTLEEVYTNGFSSLESKLRTAGFDDDDVKRALGVDFDYTPPERAERVLKLLRAGMLGEKLGPPSRDPETVAVFFQTLANIADGSRAPNGAATIQWDFTDAEPWYLQLDNGSTSVAQGHAAHADLTLRCRFEDWIDVSAGRADPRRSMLRGKLRPRGSIRMLLAMPKVFGR